MKPRVVPEKKRRIVAATAVSFRAGHRETMHVHADQGQLKWPSTGCASVRTPAGILVAAPSHAVWIPAGQEHGGLYAGDVFEQNLFVLAEWCTTLPKRCCLVRVGPQLAQTITYTVDSESGYARRSRASDLAILGVLEHTVIDTGRRALDLRIPEGSRLQAIIEMLLARPGDARSIAAWAAELQMGERSLLRAFRQATGTSFREWRKRARLHRALQMLCAGSDVARVAEELGYESTSAFVYRFRATLGITPARYYAPPSSARTA
jgi:AraC-like DNA-binding protein